MALATTYFGIKRRERAVAQYGFKRYSEALKNVHTALSKIGFATISRSTRGCHDHGAHRGKSHMSQLVLLLIVAWFLISDLENGWIHHASGLEILLDLRGPKAMVSLPCLKILERTRPAIIFAAVVLHKSTVMSDIECKIEPWQTYPERIDSMKIL